MYWTQSMLNWRQNNPRWIKKKISRDQAKRIFRDIFEISKRIYKKSYIVNYQAVNYKPAALRTPLRNWNKTSSSSSSKKFFLLVFSKLKIHLSTENKITFPCSFSLSIRCVVFKKSHILSWWQLFQHRICVHWSIESVHSKAWKTAFSKTEIFFIYCRTSWL